MSDGNLYLVTGANGFVASALVERLLALGLHVRAAVRRPASGDQLKSTLPSSPGTLEIALIPDLTSSAALLPHLSGVTHIFHAASPIPGEGKTDARRDFLDPARSATLSLLEAASQTPTVQKVVLTASVASVFNPSPPPDAPPLAHDDWNPLTYDAAVEMGEKLTVAAASPGFTPADYLSYALPIYSASKTVAEQAAWNFMSERKPQFTLAAVHPAKVVGRPSLPLGLTGSNAMFWDTLTTRPLENEGRLIGYVTLRDTVEGHVRAMQRPEADGKRFLLVGAQPTNVELVNAAHRHRKDLPFGDVTESDSTQREERFARYDTKQTERVLGIEWTAVDRMVAEFVDWAMEVRK